MRVIDEKGKQVGIIEINKALELAHKANLDLVEIAPNAKPPVTKIIELGKFKYEQEKKIKVEKRKTKSTDLKEIRLTPFIASHDLANRLERIKEFLSEKHKIRVVVRFKGRQMGSKQFGYNLLNNVLQETKDRAVLDMEPKFIGRNLAMIISPTNKAKGSLNTVKEKKQNEKKAQD